MEEQVKEPIAEYGKVFTYAEYLTWNVQDRFEILKGRLFKMTAPARRHQGVSSEFQYILMKYFDGKDCKVYDAPFDIRLVDKRTNSKKDEDIITVFQPDLCVICDRDKLDDRGCIGAPDLIVEILSPSNSTKEMKNKFELYEENGVREYWIVDYIREIILIYVLENGIYRGLKPLTNLEEARSIIFPDLVFPVKEIFKD